MPNRSRLVDVDESLIGGVTLGTTLISIVYKAKIHDGVLLVVKGL